MSDLAGRLVAVTRARQQSARFAQVLEERGARVVFFPTIAILPVQDHAPVNAAVARLENFSWVVFTSANAVAEFAKRLPSAGWPSGVRVAAIGPSTAEALAEFGIAVNAQPAVHTGSAVAGSMGNIRGAKILLPHGDLAREETAQALAAGGALLTEVVVYRTETARVDAAGLKQLRAGVDAITFTSPSTVRGFAAMLGHEATSIVSHAVVATIGPTTSAAVRAEAWGEPLEAAVATSDAIVDVLAAHFSPRHAAHGVAR